MNTFSKYEKGGFLGEKVLIRDHLKHAKSRLGNSRSSFQ